MRRSIILPTKISKLEPFISKVYDSSIQPETSKMTPKELRDFMHRSTDNVGEVLFSDKYDSKTLKQMTDNIRAERFTNKKYKNEDTSDQVVSINI